MIICNSYQFKIFYMELLFEAKAIINEETFLYNIFRMPPEKYKAEMVLEENNDTDTTFPAELVLIKKNETWQAEDKAYPELSATLGTEIDVFNNGYGDLLGRIGVR